MLIRDNKELNQKDFTNEKELQTYFEKNVDKILGCRFIETEFAVGNFRIDTLVFDEESMAFRIIEFKNVKNYSLIDQGYTYLKLMLERKADFVLKYNEKSKDFLSISDVDWSQSRIVFVSPVFTSYQLNATDFKNIPFDLIKVVKYDDNIYDIDFIQKKSDTKIEDVVNSIQTADVNKEIKVYTEDDHLEGKNDNIKSIYISLRNRILEMDDIDIDVKKVYIAFKGRKNIVDIELMQRKIILFINMKKGSLEDPYNITCDLSTSGHHGNGDYCVDIYKEEDIEKVIPLIRQSLNVNKK